MTSPRPTTKFRLAAAAMVGASRAEPTFPPEVHQRPIAVRICTAAGEPAASDEDLENRLRAAAAVQAAFQREGAVFRVVDRREDADVVMTITRASRQPSLDFWETKHAHASLLVRRTGEVLDAGADYVEGRTWEHVGSTLVFLAKLQCAEHYEVIARSGAMPDAAAAPQAESVPAREGGPPPLGVDERSLSDDRLRTLLARLRARHKPEPG